MADAFAKALDDMLAMPQFGKEAIFYPDHGNSFPITVIYGKDPNLMNMGNFEANDYEHQFLCRSSDVPSHQKYASIELNGRKFTVANIQVKEPAAMILGE